MRLGAWPLDGGVELCVWAPIHDRVDVVVTAPEPRVLPMRSTGAGYHEAFAEGLGPGARYRFRLGDRQLPDPASRAQPDDVHGDSAVIDPGVEWSDPRWVGRNLAEYVVMEVHVGTFTPEGTFDAAIARLDDLAALGVTAVELMPVSEFPGGRNWGYDGVFPYAADSSYGGPYGLRRFVDAAHARGICVVLDVVYNHLGPEGNVLPAYGPYFTDRYRTPWGAALNFDGPESDHVRRYFVENALEWVTEYKIDALRLDAVHAIVDNSAYPFVEELTDAVHERAAAEGRRIWVIAESAANDARLVMPKERGGIGCDAQWSDDFHHALHVLLTGERDAYYEDFGAVSDLAAAFRDGYVYQGRYSPSRRRRHGRPAAGLPGERFVVCAQNHDQVGNRPGGERLSVLVDERGLRIAAAAVCCAPFVPLLFMGEEYGETAPFPYFVSHGDPELVEAVRRGRRDEHAGFHRVQEQPPDPQAETTFASAKLDWERRGREPHASVLGWYRALLGLRSARAALRLPSAGTTRTWIHEDARALVVLREVPGDRVALVLGFAERSHDVPLELPAGTWRRLLDTHPDDRVRSGVFASDGSVTMKVPPRSVLVAGSDEIS